MKKKKKNNNKIIVINDTNFSKNKVKKTFENIDVNYLDLYYDSFLNFLKEIKNKKDIISRLSSSISGLTSFIDNNKTSLIANNKINSVYELKIKLYELKDKYMNKLLKEDKLIIDYINPPIEDYNVINIHPFTCNKKSYWTSSSYNEWKRIFPKQEIIIDKNIDFTKKVNIWLQFDHLEKFDVTNLSKTAIDMIVSKYKTYNKKADDKLIQLRNCSTHKIVDKYEDGKIYYIIEQGKG
jgi:hypothetical protein